MQVEGLIATNVGHIDRARVVVLLGEHEISPRYHSDCAYIQQQIRSLFIPGQSQILTEEARSNCQATRFGYAVTGWDDPEAIKKIEALRPFRTAIDTRAFRQLIDFMGATSPLTYSELQNPAACPDFAAKTKLLLLESEARLRRLTVKVTLETFQQRQESLIRRLFLSLQESRGRDRVLVIMGPEHLYSKHLQLAPSARRLRELLEQVPYAILANPKMQEGSPQHRPGS